MTMRRCLKPLPIDDRRIGKIAAECDRLEGLDGSPRAPKAERMAAYRRLADALELAAKNAQKDGQ